MPSLRLIRHAQASFGAAEYDELSDLGRRQARVLAERLRTGGPYAEIIEGSLERQRETTTILLDEADLEVAARRADARWDEYDHEEILRVAGADPDLRGEFEALGEEGTDRARAFQRVLDLALRRWAGDDEGEGYAEPWQEFVDRAWSAADAAFDGLGSGETGLVVTSGGVISAVITRVLGLDADQWQGLNRVMVNTSLTTLTRGRGGTTVVTINDHAHLENDADMRTYR